MSAIDKNYRMAKHVEAAPPGNGIDQPSLDPATVKSFKRKADFILLPILTVSYLLNSLDRSNLSNAHTAGLEDDLHLVGNQFNQVLTYYQIPFVFFGPLATLATKTFGAKRSIAAMLLGFGICSLATGWVKSFNTLVVCRVFVGAFESGFLASAIYYLSTWYTKKEIGSRIGIFYAALVSSSAFGGLLAFGVFQINPSGSYFRWSYLFFLEGSLTIIWAVVIFLTLPSNTENAWFLNPEEKQVARRRLQLDSVQNLEVKFNLKEAISEFTTPHGYIRCVIAFTIGTLLTSNQNFLAIVVGRLGFGTVKTNLYTVAPAITGAVFLVAWSKSSDHFKERGLHITAAGVVSLVGFTLLATTSTTAKAISYFAIFLCTIGAYPGTPLNAAWAVSNIPNLNARAFTSGVIISCANCGGFLSSNIYLNTEAPRYETASYTNVGMCVCIIVLSASYSCWMRVENRRRDRVQGVGSTGENGSAGALSTRDISFRFQV